MRARWKARVRRSALFLWAVVAAELMALVFLQLSSLTPYLPRMISSALHPVECRGNHAECGCSPERIASHTCCCYQHFHDCCVQAKNHDEGGSETASRAEPTGSRADRVLRVPPCGSGSKVFGAAPETTDLAPTESPRIAQVLYRSERVDGEVTRLLHRLPQPPVPPPRSPRFV